MTAGAMLELSQSEKPGKGVMTADRLWPWYLITGLYLAGCGIVLFDRSTEFGEFFKPADGSAGRLRLNEIGDIAAGIFAPLAFLWLFVATQLQRRELRLQRAELAETRQVLSEQQRELEKSARESTHQTDIMQRTLETTLTTALYNEFSLNLFYLSKIWINSVGQSVDLYDEAGGLSREQFMYLPQDGHPTQNDPTSVDNFFDLLYRQSGYLRKHSAKASKVTVAAENSVLLLQAFHDGIPPFKALVESSKNGANPLVQARARGINLEATLLNIEYLQRVITIIR
ncbi:UNVERIFIED_CONTAM: hypothetical protein Q9R58_10715 [Methylobacteriaceae bacterium AG10]|nr:hypothetical protein [Methylobacteriaceae bacterium AG10]